MRVADRSSLLEEKSMKLKPMVGLVAALSLTLATSASADVYTDYATYLLQRGGSMWDPGLSQALSQWATAPTSTNHADVTWGVPSGWPAGSSVEEHEIKSNCSGGASFIWVNAFRDTDSGNRYALYTTKATYTDINGNATYDITTGGSCGQDGQPYALYDVWDAPYQIQVWGDIKNPDGSFAKRFFWQAKYTNYVSESNPCWSAGTTTATVILQEEAWWDSVGGWLNPGTGDIDPTTHEPTGTGVKWGDFQTIASGIGFGWTYGNYDASQQRVLTKCLRYQWSW
jgi:hypothetical protein